MKLSGLPFLVLLGLARVTAASPEPAGKDSSSHWQFSLLPKSLQRKPSLDFHVVTEMTADGRKLTPPTPQQPDYYLEQPGKFTPMGRNPPANEHPPPIAELERAMQKALATNGYLLVAPSSPRPAPHLVVVFNFGSFDRFSNEFDELEQDQAADDEYQQTLLNATPGTPLPPPPIPSMPGDRDAAQLLPYILTDVAKQKDIIDRASLIGGAQFAGDLAKVIANEIDYRNSSASGVPPEDDINSPFRRFVDSNSKLFDLVEESFSSCYFVVASAYDYAAMSKGRRVLLWRTKMTVNSLGISMTESLSPLIASAGPYFGRPMTEAATITRRISREGRVDIGTPTVVDDDAASSPKAPPARKAPAPSQP